VGAGVCQGEVEWWCDPEGAIAVKASVGTQYVAVWKAQKKLDISLFFSIIEHVELDGLKGEIRKLLNFEGEIHGNNQMG